MAAARAASHGEGEDVVIAGSVSNDEAKEIFDEWKSPKPYIRIVPQPRSSRAPFLVAGFSGPPENPSNRGDHWPEDEESGPL